MRQRPGQSLRPDATDSDLLGAADRAGNVIRDQIDSMVEQAHGVAADSKREAERSAAETRRRARETTQRVVEGIHAVERECETLRSSIGREADRLRGALDRARPRSAPAAVSVSAQAGTLRLSTAPGAGLEEDLGRTLSAGPTAPVEEAPAREAAQAAKVEEAAGDEQAERAAKDEQAERAAEDEEPAVFDEAPAAETEPAHPISGPEAALEFVPRGEGSGRERGIVGDEARGRVTAKTDLELAELYAIALARSGRPGDDDAPYWDALKTATVQEASSRPSFGQPASGEDLGNRRAKKQRAKVLGPLLFARDNATGSETREGKTEP